MSSSIVMVLWRGRGGGDTKFAGVTDDAELEISRASLLIKPPQLPFFGRRLTPRRSPFLQRQELAPHGLRVAAGLAQPQQRAQDAVHGAAVQAAELQAPVGDLPEFDQRVPGADLVLPVVEVTLDGGEVEPVHLLRLRGDLDLEEQNGGDRMRLNPD